MDRPDWAWMYQSCVHPCYLIEVDKFIEAANKHATKTNSVGIICPCRICKNEMVAREHKTVRSHLICHGFVKHYHTWIYHGEEKIMYEFISDDEDMDAEIFLAARANYVDAVDNNESVEHNEGVYESIPAGCSSDLGDDCDQDEDDLEEMLKHFEADVIHRHAKGLEHFEAVKDATKQSVYDKSKGCPAHWSQLRFVIELLILKAKYGWSDSSFNDLLMLLAWLLPKPNFVPANTYRSKKVISPLTMGVEIIHACPNHCILYRGKEFKDLEKCSTCGASCYKNNEVFTGQDDQGPGIGKKRKKGSRKNVALPEEEVQTCLGIDENQRKIPALVMCNTKGFWREEDEAHLTAAWVEAVAGSGSVNEPLVVATARSSGHGPWWRSDVSVVKKMDKHSEQDALFGSYEEVFGVDDEHDTLPSDDEEQEDYLVDPFADILQADKAARELAKDPNYDPNVEATKEGDETMGSRTATSSDKKKKRGHRSKNKVPDTIYIVNKLGPTGQPIDPPSVTAKFSNTIGALVRTWLDPSIKDWRPVAGGTKTFIWNELQKVFRFPKGTEDLAQSFAMKQTGNKEHGGRVRGISSKVNWKEGFVQDRARYKRHDRFREMIREEAKAIFAERFAAYYVNPVDQLEIERHSHKDSRKTQI
ncbi:hypothetical protein U9M48_042053 [Paspalum notatum var. saurae]|uniref:Transposase-associated domain-containing protein n=1 Tax=Paspalum notatum var. saurae TaxID=547442 RepID=A0AAQ3XFJ1_PASNO